MNKNLRNLTVLSSLIIFLYSCGMGADARQFPPDAESRVKKNIEEGRGFRLFEVTRARLGDTTSIFCNLVRKKTGKGYTFKLHTAD